MMTLTKERNVCVARELRSAATAFGRVELFFFSSPDAALKGRSSTAALAFVAESWDSRFLTAAAPVRNDKFCIWLKFAARLKPRPSRMS
jgi:hypothetical protein